MADIKALKALSRDKLNAFAAENGVENPEQYQEKGQLAEVLAPKVTPEQLEDFKNRPVEAVGDPADTPPAGETNLEDEDTAAADSDATPSAPGGSSDHVDGEDDNQAADPALTPPAEPPVPTEEDEQDDPAVNPAKEDAQNGDIAVDEYVYYPYADAQSGFRRGRVTAFDEQNVEVLWADGSRRWFSRGIVRKSM